MNDIGPILREYIERIEYILEEKQALFGQLKELYAEAEKRGIDLKAFKSILKLRKLNKDEYEEQESTLSHYLEILGMKK